MCVGAALSISFSWVVCFCLALSQDDVRLYGVTVADPDARQNDDMEVEILVDSDSWGGAVAFAGERGAR